jgi:hypothetical protein
MNRELHVSWCKAAESLFEGSTNLVKRLCAEVEMVLLAHRTAHGCGGNHGRPRWPTGCTCARHSDAVDSKERASEAARRSYDAVGRKGEAGSPPIRSSGVRARKISGATEGSEASRCRSADQGYTVVVEMEAQTISMVLVTSGGMEPIG